MLSSALSEVIEDAESCVYNNMGEVLSKCAKFVAGKKKAVTLKTKFNRRGVKAISIPRRIRANFICELHLTIDKENKTLSPQLVSTVAIRGECVCTKPESLKDVDIAKTVVMAMKHMEKKQVSIATGRVYRKDGTRVLLSFDGEADRVEMFEILNRVNSNAPMLRTLLIGDNEHVDIHVPKCANEMKLNDDWELRVVDLVSLLGPKAALRYMKPLFDGDEEVAIKNVIASPRVTISKKRMANRSDSAMIMSHPRACVTNNGFIWVGHKDITHTGHLDDDKIPNLIHRLSNPSTAVLSDKDMLNQIDLLTEQNRLLHENRVTMENNRNMLLKVQRSTDKHLRYYRKLSDTLNKKILLLQGRLRKTRTLHQAKPQVRTVRNTHEDLEAVYRKRLEKMRSKITSGFEDKVRAKVNSMHNKILSKHRSEIRRQGVEITRKGELVRSLRETIKELRASKPRKIKQATEKKQTTEKKKSNPITVQKTRGGPRAKEYRSTIKSLRNNLSVKDSLVIHIQKSNDSISMALTKLQIENSNLRMENQRLVVSANKGVCMMMGV